MVKGPGEGAHSEDQAVVRPQWFHIRADLPVKKLGVEAATSQPFLPVFFVNLLDTRLAAGEVYAQPLTSPAINQSID